MSDFGVRSPTRYPYTDHLLDPRMTEMTGVPGVRELERVFALAPSIVVVGDLRPARLDPVAVSLIEARLARDYRPVSGAGGATLYVRSAASGVSESRPR